MAPLLSVIPGCNPACHACHYKELTYSEQLIRKQEWASKCLHEWEDKLRPIRPAPKEDRIAYRSKTWMRSRVLGEDVSFGFFRALRGEAKWEKEFISWDTCPIHTRAIQATVRSLKNAIEDGALPFAKESLFGVWIGVPHLVLVGKFEPDESMKSFEWSRILDPKIRKVSFYKTSQVGKTVFGEGGEFFVLYDVSGGAGDIPPVRAFRQVARNLVLEARTAALDFLLRSRPPLILDLYCGTGDLAALLPDETSWIGIESSKDAVAFANRDQKSGRSAFSGFIENRLRDSRIREKISGQYGLYLNPPRSGLGSEGQTTILDLLRERPAEKIAYLSCSASSLARDLEVLRMAGYRVENLQPYDFFPQTEHFEMLALLSR